MVKRDDSEFQGIPNEALLKVLVRTIHDAAFIKAAGLPLPEFRQPEPEPEESKTPAPEGFRLSNAGLGEYLRVAAEITQRAADLRTLQKRKALTLDL